jgi:DNA-binding winged helix-turn-helix (wHTH) protein
VGAARKGTFVTVPGTALRFEILGPLRAWREDTELDLGPGKQRAVLAVLLLNANRPTPTSRIIDAVWGDLPPENGVNVVQKYVAGLRRILEPGRSPRTPGQLLTWTEAGYTLHVPPGGLDTDVFREHVALAARPTPPDISRRRSRCGVNRPWPGCAALSSTPPASGSPRTGRRPSRSPLRSSSTWATTSGSCPS